MAEYGLKFEKVTVRFGQVSNIFNFFIRQMTSSEIQSLAVGVSEDETFPLDDCDNDLDIDGVRQSVSVLEDSTRTSNHIDDERSSDPGLAGSSSD